MEWQFIIAVVIAVPVILLPALFIWYVGMTIASGLYPQSKYCRGCIRRFRGDSQTDTFIYIRVNEAGTHAAYAKQS
jgi:hypothetical protein